MCLRVPPSTVRLARTDLTANPSIRHRSRSVAEHRDSRREWTWAAPFFLFGYGSDQEFPWLERKTGFEPATHTLAT